MNLRKANFSDCRTWRYTLLRSWAKTRFGGKVCFIGLNPSTADETIDDPTIRRCVGFAKSWGYDAIQMINLFAFRATKPKDMKAAVDPIGPRNDEWIKYMISHCDLVVAAWGTHGSFMDRNKKVIELAGERLHCLGKTKAGHPKHPLYLSKETELEFFNGK